MLEEVFLCHLGPGCPEPFLALLFVIQAPSPEALPQGLDGRGHYEDGHRLWIAGLKLPGPLNVYVQHHIKAPAPHLFELAGGSSVKMPVDLGPLGKLPAGELLPENLLAQEIVFFPVPLPRPGGPRGAGDGMPEVRDFPKKGLDQGVFPGSRRG